jgi:hypothetical protein
MKIATIKVSAIRYAAQSPWRVAAEIREDVGLPAIGDVPAAGDLSETLGAIDSDGDRVGAMSGDCAEAGGGGAEGGLRGWIGGRLEEAVGDKAEGTNGARVGGAKGDNVGGATGGNAGVSMGGNVGVAVGGNAGGSAGGAEGTGGGETRRVNVYGAVVAPQVKRQEKILIE